MVKRIDVAGDAAVPLAKAFLDGFASEMLRTVYIAKQLMLDDVAAGAPSFPAAARPRARDPMCFVLGLDRQGSQRGLALARWLRAPIERPDTAWLPVSGKDLRDKDLIPAISGQLAGHVAQLISTRGTLDPGTSGTGPLSEGYRLAMEVIAREWRNRMGPRGAGCEDMGTGRCKIFADVRENRLVLAADGVTVRPPGELLADAGVAATIIYRLAQTRGVANRAAPASYYTPFVQGSLPAGINPAALLGPFRNFQAKWLGAWARAALSSQPPRDIIDLVTAYVEMFPSEKAEVLRVFLVSTYAATVKPGGVTTRAQDARAALDEVALLTAAVGSGKKSLREVPQQP